MSPCGTVSVLVGARGSRPFLSLLSHDSVGQRREMNRFSECGTQTDAVVVLSLAQAAVLGLVSDNELLGATVTPTGFFPGLAGEQLDNATMEPGEPESEEQVAGDGQDEDTLEAESSLEKHARRRKRPPVRLVPKVKSEKAEVEAEPPYNASVPGDEEGEGQHGHPPQPPEPGQ